MAKKEKASKTDQGPPVPGSVFESLLFVAVAGILLGIAFLAMVLNRYGWTLSP